MSHNGRTGRMQNGSSISMPISSTPNMSHPRMNIAGIIAAPSCNHSENGRVSSHRVRMRLVCLVYEMGMGVYRIFSLSESTEESSLTMISHC